MIGSELVDSITVRSGVRQGCPLSPLIFAICSHLLLTRLEAMLSAHEVVSAFADDTAAVIRDWVRTLPCLATCFTEFQAISALELNIGKTVFIPLWPCSNFERLRLLIRELVPRWGDIIIADRAKYLGFTIGPGACGHSWVGPLCKYAERATAWFHLPLGLFWNIMVYHTFVASVLSFPMQLERDPEELRATFEQVVRKLAPGPYNWISPQDLVNLRETFCFPISIRLPSATSLAAKLRVIETVAPDCHARCRELAELEDGVLLGPFGSWHTNSYYAVLASAEDEIGKLGITRSSVRRSVRGASGHGGGKSFQAQAEMMIKTAVCANYCGHNRVRARISRWSLPIYP